jgi:hypothetical protein
LEIRPFVFEFSFCRPVSVSSVSDAPSAKIMVVPLAFAKPSAEQGRRGPQAPKQEHASGIRASFLRSLSAEN